MAKKPIVTGFVDKTAEPKREKAPYGQMTFVLNNLDDGQLAELDSFENNPPNLFDFLTDCVDKGIDVKLAYDGYSKAYQAVATGGWKGFPSCGFGTSSFSRSGIDDALFVLWYKVVIVCQFDLSVANGREKRTRERG